LIWTIKPKQFKSLDIGLSLECFDWASKLLDYSTIIYSPYAITLIMSFRWIECGT
jgi:hypothetical protein